MPRCLKINLLSFALLLLGGPVYAGCANPTGKEADLVYNGDYHTYQFCNGTVWKASGPVITVTAR